jgi:hypothetical protein
MQALSGVTETGLGAPTRSAVRVYSPGELITVQDETGEAAPTKETISSPKKRNNALWNMNYFSKPRYYNILML